MNPSLPRLTLGTYAQVTIVEPASLHLPVREGGPPLQVTAVLSVSSESLGGKRVQLVIVPENTGAIAPVITAGPGIFVAPYALVVLSTPNIPEDQLPVAGSGGGAAAGAPLGNFCETQIGLIPSDPAKPGELLQSWKELPNLFFKDEGSKDRCMGAEVALVSVNKEDPAGPLKVVTGVKLHLKVALAFSDFAEAPSYCSSGGRRRAGGQPLLHVDKGSVMHINPETGRTQVEFRVNDVSKNHDGRPFRLAVMADLGDDVSSASALAMDGPVVASHVAPAFSHGIEVRSKRRKARKGKPGEASVAAAAAAFGGIASGGVPPLQAEVSGSSGGRVVAAPALHSVSTLRRSMNSVISWANQVVELLQHTLQWQSYTAADGHMRMRCPVCSVDVPCHAVQEGRAAHGPSCRLHKTIDTYSGGTLAALNTLVEHIHGPEATQRARERARTTGLSGGLSGNSSDMPSARVPRPGIGVNPTASRVADQVAAAPPAPPIPPLSREESLGTMFARTAMERSAKMQSQHASMHGKREREFTYGTVSSTVQASAPKRPAPERATPSGTHPAMPGMGAAPALLPGGVPVLARAASNESMQSMDGEHGDGPLAFLAPASHSLSGGGLVPPPPAMTTQTSILADGRDGWDVDISAAPRGHSLSNSPAPPAPTDGPSFFRGSSGSSLTGR